MSLNVAEMVHKLEQGGKNVTQANRKAVSSSALFAKNTFIAGAKSVNTPTRLRGSRGKAWSVRYVETGSTLDPTALVFFVGAAPYWRERGIKAHDITPRKKQALLMPDGSLVSRAAHPGVGARPFWPATKDAVAAGSGRILQLSVTSALLKAGFR